MFCKISSYSISWTKSTVLRLCTNGWDAAVQASPLPPRTGNITYLGINISSKLPELFNLNFTPLLKTINDDLQRRTTLSISIMGRIATIKMTIFPKINSVFSDPHSAHSSTWFKSLDSIVSKFYWKNKPPRIKLATIQKIQIPRRPRSAHTFSIIFLQTNSSIYLHGPIPSS